MSAPSLLSALLADHLDPGYAAAANAPRRSPGVSRVWTAGGAGLVGLVLGVALVTAAEPETEQVRSALVQEVRQGQDAGAALSGRRDALSGEAEQARAQALAGDARGEAALDELAALDRQAAATAVVGPGLRITIGDSGELDGGGDLGAGVLGGGVLGADADGAADAGLQGSVLDRDLQSVVNALWAAGAEAVAVGGVRLGPGSTVRQAGGAMLVDDQPVPAPYTVAAIGDPGELETGFVVSDAYLRLEAVVQVYGVEVDVAPVERLELVAAEAEELREAAAVGAP